MAISSTSFSERMDRINSGRTTSWTVPGEGLATVRDEKSFLRKCRVKAPKMAVGKPERRSTQKRRNPLRYVMALLAGAMSVIAARWLDYTYAGQVAEFVNGFGLDMMVMTEKVPMALAIAALLSLFAMGFLGLRGKSGLALQAMGFLGALVFEPDLVVLAPEFYAYLYPPDWISSMMAQASLLA